MKVSIIGLGYVGLPLACLLARKSSVIGYDINTTRIAELSSGCDVTNEVDPTELTGITFTDEPEMMLGSDVFIVTVPTPVTSENQPDLTLLKAATQTVGEIIRDGAVVVFESTVYPGVTEDILIPILENTSQLNSPDNFAVGFSPERVNPSDKIFTIENITKVISANCSAGLEKIKAIYEQAIPAGIYVAPNIKTAEMAKALENTQRDLNIALMNESAIIANEIGINISEVIETAASKWNFAKYHPGLVGGHCIGVDPYYLISKAEKLGVSADLMKAARSVNEGMPKRVAAVLNHQLTTRGIDSGKTDSLVLGFSFKKNCADIRNTKVATLIKTLSYSMASCDVYDPIVDASKAYNQYSVNIINALDKIKKNYHLIIINVLHDHIISDLPKLLDQCCNSDSIFFSIPAFSVISRQDVLSQRP